MSETFKWLAQCIDARGNCPYQFQKGLIVVFIHKDIELYKDMGFSSDAALIEERPNETGRLPSDLSAHFVERKNFSKLAERLYSHYEMNYNGGQTCPKRMERGPAPAPAPVYMTPAPVHVPVPVVHVAPPMHVAPPSVYVSPVPVPVPAPQHFETVRVEFNGPAPTKDEGGFGKDFQRQRFVPAPGFGTAGFQPPAHVETKVVETNHHHHHQHHQVTIDHSPQPPTTGGGFNIDLGGMGITMSVSGGGQTGSFSMGTGPNNGAGMNLTSYPQQQPPYQQAPPLQQQPSPAPAPVIRALPVRVDVNQPHLGFNKFPAYLGFAFRNVAMHHTHVRGVDWFQGLDPNQKPFLQALPGGKNWIRNDVLVSVLHHCDRREIGTTINWLFECVSQKCQEYPEYLRNGLILVFLRSDWKLWKSKMGPQERELSEKCPNHERNNLGHTYVGRFVATCNLDRFATALANHYSNNYPVGTQPIVDRPDPVPTSHKKKRKVDVKGNTYRLKLYPQQGPMGGPYQ